MPYEPPLYEAVIPDEVRAQKAGTTTVLVAGAGPIGLAVALDLGRKGHQVVIVDRDTQLSDGSRAICFAKRPLEILDRLGVAEQMVEKGVSWNVGKVFFREEEDPIYTFDLLPIKDQKFPGMINLQQYYAEEYLIEAIASCENVTLRWGNEVTAVEQGKDSVEATITTPQGDYQLRADWLIAADGAHSPIRKMLGAPFEGQTFQDNFLIADVKFSVDMPDERHFWFNPAFNRDHSVLLHKQPDDVWRVDFQVGWDVDREEEVKEENVTRRIKHMMGEDFEFEYEWISIYTFNCRRIDRMVYDRVLFAGDSAHLVSPFGARGANTGFQDGDNLAWKLDLIIRGQAGQGLINSYDEERLLAADVNILNSTRSTDFITPKSPASKTFRDSVLELSRDHSFARSFVNSGRLSTPVPYPDSSLNTADMDDWDWGVPPGHPALDAPVSDGGRNGWLLNHTGQKFTALVFESRDGISPDLREGLRKLAKDAVPIQSLVIVEDGRAVDGEFKTLNDMRGLVEERYGASPGSVYLLRPDQYVAARWRNCTVEHIVAARDRAIGREGDNG